MKINNSIKIKSPPRPVRWEAHCTEALLRLAGISVIENTKRQACSEALKAHLHEHISAESISTFLGAAFNKKGFNQEAGKPRRTLDFTPHRLFRSHHIANIVYERTDILISKPSILAVLGAELESAILADLTPTKIRQIICLALDSHVPTPPRKRQTKNPAASNPSTTKDVPEALSTRVTISDDSPV